MKRLLCMIGAICLIILPIQAQQIMIGGRITDIQTGESLKGANIYLTKQKKGVVSDHQGNFKMTLPVGERQKCG